MAKLEEMIKTAETHPAAPRSAPDIAAGVVKELEAVAHLDADASAKLKELVVKALDEKFVEAQDVRLGRVLGSALATL
jgi:hypothetical protein